MQCALSILPSEFITVTTTTEVYTLLYADSSYPPPLLDPNFLLSILVVERQQV
jgi:hypothetical protein